MMHLLRVLALVPLAAAALTACDDLDSNPSSTEQDPPGDLRAIIEVDTRFHESDEDSEDSEAEAEAETEVFRTDVRFRLSQGEDDEAVNIVLDDDDTLKAITAAGSVDLEKEEHPEDGTIYTHTFEPAITADRLTVSLNRKTPPPDTLWFPANDSAEVDFSEYLVDAPNTRIDLPPDVTIDSPENGDGIFAEDGAEVTVTWSPNNVWTPDNVSKPDATDNDVDDGIDTAHTLDFRTECPGLDVRNQGRFDIEGDPGEVTIELVEFFKVQSDPDERLLIDPENTACLVHLKIVRHATGVADPALADTSRINAMLLSREVIIATCPPGSFDSCPPEDDS